jgi:hypothetical protein
MPWIRLEDTFTEHPKVLEVGQRAAWVHVRAISYCSVHLTDGHLSPAVARAVGATTSIAEALVEARLWEKNGDGGYLIHDYLEYQPSKAHVEEQRRIKSEAAKKGGASKK